MPKDPETILFDSLMTEVSIYAGETDGAGAFVYDQLSFTPTPGAVHAFAAGPGRNGGCEKARGVEKQKFNPTCAS
jgi:hypothetical protein